MPLRVTPRRRKLAGPARIPRIRPDDADSGKVYALGNWLCPWQTCPRHCCGPQFARVQKRIRVGLANRKNMVAEQNALSGVKVMVIDDSNTIRRSAEIFLLQAGCAVILAEDGFDALAKIADHQPGSRVRRHHDAAARRLPDLRAHQEEREVPCDTGDHAVVEGRPLRPGARAHGRLRPVPDEAVHEGKPAQGRRHARDARAAPRERRRRRPTERCAARRRKASSSP